MTRVVLVASVLMVAALDVSAAQFAPQLPPRDGVKPASKGTAVVRGVVVDAQDGTPLPRALVSLNGASQPVSVLTDNEGRFEFRELPAGKVFLHVNRAPYLQTTYGQTGRNTPATPIVVGDGEVIEKVAITLSRGGVISGRVYDEFGFPAVGVQMQAMQYRYEQGARRLTAVYGGSAMMGLTDDLGAFRIFGLEPGQYFVSANPNLSMMRTTNAPLAQGSGPITTYFPNAADAGGAQRISVAAGKEVSGINITLVSGRLARLRGRAVMSTGEPFAGATVSVGRSEQGFGFSSSSGRNVAADGTFEVSGLAPGQYVLSVRPNSAREDADVEVARVRLTVSGEDIDNVILVGSRGATLRGRIVTDEGSAAPIRPSAVAVRVEPPADDRGAFMPFMRPQPVADDYSFEIKGLFGRGRVEALMMLDAGVTPAEGRGWSTKSVFWRGDDITGQYIDLEPGAVLEGIEIVLSRRFAELSGTVTDDRGRPVAEGWLVLFPADENRWTTPRYVRPIRTTPDGTFKATALLAGEYLIASTGTLEPGQWQDPELLRSLVERATRVTIRDGEPTTQNLRIASQ
jgi:hypothetical protein